MATSLNKRILYLNYEFPPLGGGASPASYDTAIRLSNEGYSLDVVTMAFKGLPKYEEINSNLRIHRVTSFRRKKQISYPFEQLAYLFFAFFKAIKLHRERDFKFTYTHFIIPTGALALILKRAVGLKFLLVSHGSDVLGYNSRFKSLYKILLAPWKSIVDNALFLMVPSVFLKKQILSVNPEFHEKNLFIIPNIVEGGVFSPMTKKKHILLVSRLHEDKGLQDLLRAFAEIGDKSWKVIILGDGPYKGKLKKLAKELGIFKNVVFAGWVSSLAEKKKYYGEATIYVNSSYKESFGITTVEAMQAGCSCIVSKTGIAEELENIHIYDPGDLNALKDSLSFVMNEADPKISSSHLCYTSSAVWPKLNNLIKERIYEITKK